MRCHSQSLTIKLKRDVPLADIEAMIAADNEWVQGRAEHARGDHARPHAGGRHRHADDSGRPLAQARDGPDYLGAFTIGDQLLWGAAEPLRRMLRILLER